MDVTNKCPHCGGGVEFDAAGIGSQVDCPHCQKVFQLHDPAPPVIQPQPPLQPIAPIQRGNARPCKECGGLVGKSADRCPHCGAKNKRQVGTAAGCFAIIVLVFVGCIFASLFSDTGGGSGATASSSGKTVRASVKRTTTHLIIKNISAEAWPGVTVYINGTPPFTYRADLQPIPGGETVEVPLSSFEKKNGERFNWQTHSVVVVWIGGGGYDFTNWGF